MILVVRPRIEYRNSVPWYSSQAFRIVTIELAIMLNAIPTAIHIHKSRNLGASSSVELRYLSRLGLVSGRIILTLLRTNCPKLKSQDTSLVSLSLGNSCKSLVTPNVLHLLQTMETRQSWVRLKDLVIHV